MTSEQFAAEAIAEFERIARREFIREERDLLVALVAMACVKSEAAGYAQASDSSQRVLAAIAKVA